MFRYLDFKAFFFLFSNIAFFYIISVLNGEISPYFYLAIPAVYIIPSALFLDFLPMVFVVVFSAFFVESTTPLRTGIIPVLWLVVAFFVYGARFRFRGRDKFSIAMLFVIVNVIILFFYSLFFPTDSKSLFAYVVRVSADVLLSSSILLLIANFSLSIPLALANIFGFDLSINDSNK